MTKESVREALRWAMVTTWIIQAVAVMMHLLGL